MKTRAAVLRGKKDIVIQEYELPEIGDEELLVKIISNSICLSTYKAAILGEEHKRVPADIREHPVITGHEFSGVIAEVGQKLKDRFGVGERFALQPAMNLDNGYSSGYSYPYFGGNATYCIIPKVAIDKGCVLPYNQAYHANASLAEPMSCIIGAFHATYHTENYVYEHQMGLKDGGSVALLGCAGPMGIGAIDYAVNGPYNSKRVVVVDIDEDRLQRAQQLITPAKAEEKGVELTYINSRGLADATAEIRALNGGAGYDEVFVFAAASSLIEQGGDLLGMDGCLNFFAGPTDKAFKAPFNFYNVHYERTHLVGTSGGSTEDMLECLNLTQENVLNPSYMITHVGGLDAAPDTILNQPNIPGGKKVIYPHVTLPLTPIEDFRKLAGKSMLYKGLADICEAHANIWCEEAEKFLLGYFGVD
jgi:threonine dehydrogenase-like Zn-dependent dehydrogenase